MARHSTPRIPMHSAEQVRDALRVAQFDWNTYNKEQEEAAAADAHQREAYSLALAISTAEREAGRDLCSHLRRLRQDDHSYLAGLREHVDFRRIADNLPEFWSLKLLKQHLDRPPEARAILRDTIRNHMSASPIAIAKGEDALRQAVDREFRAQIHALAKDQRRTGTDTGMPDEKKIRRALRQRLRQNRAQIANHLKLVGRGATKWTDREMRRDRVTMDAKNGKWADGIQVQAHGMPDSIPLSQIINTNQKGRRAFIFAALKGIQKAAEHEGMEFAFITVTAPAAFHPNPSHGACTWDGATMREAQDWLNNELGRVWARLEKVGKKDGEEGIQPHGIRVNEPHRDGCPHTHLWLAFPAGCRDEVLSAFRKSWPSLCDDPDVPNNIRWLADSPTNGKQKASPASYVAKYIIKSLTGEPDAMPIAAWSSCWSIRKFSWLGLPQMSLWNELGRLKECPDRADASALWYAVRSGDFAEFLRLTGGLNCKRKNRTYRLKQNDDPTAKANSIQHRIGLPIFGWLRMKATILKGVRLNTNYSSKSPIHPDSAGVLGAPPPLISKTVGRSPPDPAVAGVNQ